jgi:hypothetical protein
LKSLFVRITPPSHSLSVALLFLLVSGIVMVLNDLHHLAH